jgi:glutathione peroxidase
LNYGVSFPVLGKIDVNGDKADPVYQYLKNEKAGILGLTRIKYVTPKIMLTVDGTSYELV